MAGRYQYLLHGDDGSISGLTHGCGCCAHYEEVGVRELQEHIKWLEQDLTRTKEILSQLEAKKTEVPGP